MSNAFLRFLVLSILFYGPLSIICHPSLNNQRVFRSFQSINVTHEKISLKHLDQLLPERPFGSPTVESASDTNVVIHGIVHPRPPMIVSMNEPAAFVFRASVGSDSASLLISLGMKVPDAETPLVLTDLGKIKVTGAVSDYMIIWTPKVSDHIPEDGGNDFVFVFQKPTWWGWGRELIFVTQSFKIHALKAQSP